MTEYKCGDCFHAEVCEKSEMLVGFSKDNYAYCGMFLNSADVAPVRHGRWIDKGEYAACMECGGRSGTQYDGVEPVPLTTQLGQNCGTKMDEVSE